MKKIVLIVLLITMAFIIAGCAEPQGGSSLPWSRPEPWENKINIGEQF